MNDPHDSAPSHRLATAARAAKTVLVERDGLKVVRLALPPGGEVPEHHANVDVIATVVRGRGTFTVEGVARAVTVGDVVEMRPRVRHAVGAAADEPLELVVVHVRVAATTDPVHCGG